ncbi:MAG: hypothetical protein H0U73_02220 [Tatlockia sp.]|nr:hypothetical protein [Tatlockia sp.]
MTIDIKREKKAARMAEAHLNIGGFIFGVLIELMAISKKAFAAIGQSFFFLSWVNEAFGLAWQSLSYKWSYNKNLDKTGGLVVEWLKFILSTIMLFGSALLVGTVQIAAFGVILALTPFICLVRAAYYFAKAVLTDNPKVAEAHFDQVKTNVSSALISGFLGMCIAALIYIPALPLAVTATLATIVCAVLIPPISVGFIKQMVDLWTNLAQGISKLWRKHQGLQGPGYRYDVQSGETLDNNQLKKNIIYVDKLAKDAEGDLFLSYRFKDELEIIREGTFKQYALPDEKLADWPKNLSKKELKKLKPHFDLFAPSLLQAVKPSTVDGISKNLRQLEQPAISFKPVLSPKATTKELPLYSSKGTVFREKQKNYHRKERNVYLAHLSAPDLKSVEELTAETARQIKLLTSHPASFFQDKKRQDKIESLHILTRALNQWSDLYQNKSSPALNYNSIVLDDKTEISRVINPHLDFNISANREIIIKRIEQYILVQYPEAYQSFFRGKGSVATLFQQGFDLMRRMKTQEEINLERVAIENEIDNSEKKYVGLRGYFANDEEKTKHEESIKLLRDFLNGSATTEDVNNNAELKASHRGNGTRYQLCQRIVEIHESEKLLYKKEDSLDDAFGL